MAVNRREERVLLLLIGMLLGLGLPFFVAGAMLMLTDQKMQVRIVSAR